MENLLTIKQGDTKFCLCAEKEDGAYEHAPFQLNVDLEEMIIHGAFIPTPIYNYLDLEGDVELTVAIKKNDAIISFIRQTLPCEYLSPYANIAILVNKAIMPEGGMQ